VEEIKKRIIGNGVSGFITKNIHICIYTNLYFGGGKCQKAITILEMVV